MQMVYSSCSSNVALVFARCHRIEMRRPSICIWSCSIVAMLLICSASLATVTSGRQLLDTAHAPKWDSSAALRHFQPIGFSQIFLSFAAFALFVFASRTSPFVSLPMRQRVDRTAMLACAALVIFAFVQHVQIAAAHGDLSMRRFLQYFLAGGICAFLTHAACTPIDVVKTRIQMTHGKYNGLLDGYRKIIAEEGPAALLKGLSATAGGYFLHGAFKYSLYEIFKVIYSANAAMALKPPLKIAGLSGLCAESIACIVLCPMEAVRIRSVADHLFPTGALDGLTLLFKVEGFHGLYKGLPAMLLKQVPYTMGQFVSFEFFVVVVRASVFALLGLTAGSAPSSLVAFIAALSGLLAGIVAAIVSHPGDTILSRINQQESEGSAFAQIERVVRTAGFFGLFSGLSVRIIQVSCMVGGQFVIYDIIKLMCGIVPASAMGTAVSVKHSNLASAALQGHGGAPSVGNHSNAIITNSRTAFMDKIHGHPRH